MLCESVGDLCASGEDLGDEDISDLVLNTVENQFRCICPSSFLNS